MPGPEIALLLHLLDEAYDHQAWHGPNLRGAIRRVEFTLAAWRPAPERHNIWETVLHAAYWKYTVRRQLLGEKRGSFPRKGSNWFVRPDGEPTDAAWREDVALLEQMHRTLRAAIADLPSDELHRTPASSKHTRARLIAGVAAHDVYHAGQIQLLKRLAGAESAE
jgi:uncharacterized damage-inducible protein DinB